jgi:hypothetical protein
MAAGRMPLASRGEPTKTPFKHKKILKNQKILVSTIWPMNYGDEFLPVRGENHPQAAGKCPAWLINYIEGATCHACVGRPRRGALLLGIEARGRL